MREYNSKDLLTANRTFISDEKGKRIAAFNYDVNDQIISIDSFKYDLNGSRIQDITYKLDHTLKRKMFTSYDSNGVVTASYMYGSDGNLEFGYRFKFDNSRQRLESEYLREDSTAVGTNVYKYSDFDKKGN